MKSNRLFKIISIYILWMLIFNMFMKVFTNFVNFDAQLWFLDLLYYEVEHGKKKSINLKWLFYFKINLLVFFLYLRKISNLTIQMLLHIFKAQTM